MLERRAERLEARSPEQPYLLLYALHASRGAHGAAAATMLAWARRLQAGQPSDAATLADIEAALGASLLVLMMKYREN